MFKIGLYVKAIERLFWEHQFTVVIFDLTACPPHIDARGS